MSLDVALPKLKYVAKSKAKVGKDALSVCLNEKHFKATRKRERVKQKTWGHLVCHLRDPFGKGALYEPM